jgi:hypothetical protein
LVKISIGGFEAQAITDGSNLGAWERKANAAATQSAEVLALP